MIIGIGNKARNGKDTFAEFFKQLDPAAHIIKWADKLYDEVKNLPRELPLIKYEKDYFLLLNKDNCKKVGTYEIYHVSTFPYLLQIFQNRHIFEYWGMNEKDPEILQFWGTDFRRKMFSEDYWVVKTLAEIESMRKTYGNNINIIVPDTRFWNEYTAIKNLGGIYIRITRFNLDGTNYIDPSRDPNHLSEIDLDDIIPDVDLRNEDGKLDQLYKECQDFKKRMGI